MRPAQRMRTHTQITNIQESPISCTILGKFILLIVRLSQFIEACIFYIQHRQAVLCFWSVAHWSETQKITVAPSPSIQMMMMRENRIHTLIYILFHGLHERLTAFLHNTLQYHFFGLFVFVLCPSRVKRDKNAKTYNQRLKQ
jgi:hypothetical protein